MNITDDSPPIVSALDRPNSYIGRSVPRPNLARLTQGRAQFVSDVTLPRMAHVAFVRSPHAHARIVAIKSAPQHAIAVERACWQGEAICAVIARTRAEAEDACELLEVTYQELPAVT